MNKIFKLFLVSIWLMSSTVMYGYGLPSFSGGAGTEADPYKIATLADLNTLSTTTAHWVAGRYFKQTADIDASSTSTLNSGAGFSPIGNMDTQFNGNYNGDGHTIKGLYINRPTTDYVGLFGYIAFGEIKNLGVLNVAITGRDIVGGLMGGNNGLVSNCYSTGSVVGTNTVGGFVGSNTVTMSNCYSTGSVVGTSYVGGLLGYNMGGVGNCYSTGSVVGTSYVGGLVGYNDDESSTVSNSFWDTQTSGQLASAAGTGKTTTQMKTQAIFTGWDFPTTWKIDANKNNGYPYLAWQVFPAPEIDVKQGATAIVDGTSTYDFGSKTTATNTDIVFTIENTGTVASTLGSFTITGTNANQFSLQGTNPTTVDNAGSTTFTIRFTPTSAGSKTATVSFANQDADENPYNFTITGTGQQAFSGGAGTQADPYKIAALADLEFLCFNSAFWAVGKYYIQTADIDASATSGWSRGDGFSPIGNFTTSFSGNYNGQNFTISGLSINRASSAVGLFGFADMNSTLSNLKLTNCNITGVNQVGTIVGLSYGTVSNISSSGSVTGSGHSIGGLIGSVSKSVSNCNSSCTVTGGAQYIGGLIGNAGCETITNCFSTGTVTGSTAVYVGGFAGVISDATVNSCYSTSNVTGSTNVGGFAGVINNMMSPVNITNSYATGTVKGTDAIAGFTGKADFEGGTISKCYSRSIVTLGSAPDLAPSKFNSPIMRLDRPTAINGFVGSYYGGAISNCYFDADVDGLVATTTGTSNNGATGKSTAEMKTQATFAGWDFPTTWTLNSTDNGGYPALAWQGFTNGDPMKLVFTTTEASKSIALPLNGTVNCTVNWGDGSAPENFTTSGDKPHTFATAGTYTVSIIGSLTWFGAFSAWAGVEYLTSVSDFGSIGLTDLTGAFIEADNLTSVPTTLPTTVTNLGGCFSFIDQNSITNLDSWNTSSVTNMRSMFLYASAFNQNISNWDVSNVTNMSYMFQGTSFNQNIGSWNVGKVTEMENMFKNVTLSTANYDALLIGWAAQTVKPNVVFSGGNSKYTAGTAATARGTLTGGTNLWTITDGGQDIGTSLENLNNNLSLQISPNPVRNQLRINGLCGNAEITIMDMTGKIFQKEQVSSASMVSVSNLPKGLYVVQVNNENKTVRMKMIKE